MKHHKSKRSFGREKNQRNALMKSLALALVINKKITTTEAKAKELRPFIEKIVTKAKVGGLTSRREILSQVGEKAVKPLIEVIAPKYKDRKGGYTRVVKLPRRDSDASKMAHIEFV